MYMQIKDLIYSSPIPINEITSKQTHPTWGDSELISKFISA